MQDDRVSKTSLWRQPVVWAAGAAVLLVVGGVGWMIYSAEELDEQLNRDAAVAGDSGRQAEREQAYIEPAALDARHRDSQGGGTSTPLPEELDAATLAPLPSESAEDNPTTPPSDVKSAEQAKAARVPSQQPAPSKLAEPVVETPPAEPQPAEPAGPRPPDWLKCNENGEPYEVTLADGTVLKLDTYGDEYEGYEFRPPMPAEKAEILVDYKRMGRDGLYGGGMQLDLKHKKMYWGETQGGDHPSSILRANLNGSHVEVVVDRHPLRPGFFALDPDGGKIYWVNLGRADGSGRSVERANLEGSNPETIIPNAPGVEAISVNGAVRKLYRFDFHNLLCSELDGGDEIRVAVETLPGAPSTLLVDHESKRLYWDLNRWLIRSCGFDDGTIESVVNVGEDAARFRRVALDARAGKVYWANESYHGHIRRANLDGSHIETAIVGIHNPNGLEFDTTRQQIYWMERFADDNGSQHFSSHLLS